MIFVSYMEIETHPAQREQAIDAFLALDVFTNCAKAIPGFIDGHLIADLANENAVAVISFWRDRSDYNAWQSHPVRADQEAILGRFLARAPVVKLFHQRGR